MAVVNVIELVADSEKGWEDAVANAVAEAARTVRNITGVEVINLTATVDEGRIKSYRANMNVAFVVDEDRAKAGAGAAAR
jgi:flavin-binding protein dodecin